MKDAYGRNINYLRVSVTKRCFLRCVYCGAETETGEDELTAAQIEKIVRAFANCGITKVRLTGGEPLIREDICLIAQRIKKIDGIKKLVLTTNGIRLSQKAEDLKKSGISAVNISLDTLDKKRYFELTGADCLGMVLDGIRAAQECGLSPIRINSVLLRGKNDCDAEALIMFAKEHSIDVRFIELMPFSQPENNDRLIIKSNEILERFPFLVPAQSRGSVFEQSVARYYTAEGFKGRIGFITPISNSFCEGCNRIRLLSDGKVRPCLGDEREIDIRPLLENDEELYAAVKAAIFSKPMSHPFSCGYGSFHGLNKIGG